MNVEFLLPAEVLDEKLIWQNVEKAGQAFRVPLHQIERIQVALLRTVITALEYNQKETSAGKLPILVRICLSTTQAPDTRQAEAEGDWSQQSWGYFIINKLQGAGEMNTEGGFHLIELILYPEGRRR